jgi:hypothetical protein
VSGEEENHHAAIHSIWWQLPVKLAIYSVVAHHCVGLRLAPLLLAHQQGKVSIFKSMLLAVGCGFLVMVPLLAKPYPYISHYTKLITDFFNQHDLTCIFDRFQHPVTCSYDDKLFFIFLFFVNLHL